METAGGKAEAAGGKAEAADIDQPALRRETGPNRTLSGKHDTRRRAANSDRDSLAIRVALESPLTSAPKRGARRKRVFHELQIAAAAILASGKHSERARDDFGQYGRSVGKSAKRRGVEVGAEDRLRLQ